MNFDKISVEKDNEKYSLDAERWLLQLYVTWLLGLSKMAVTSSFLW